MGQLCYQSLNPISFHDGVLAEPRPASSKLAMICMLSTNSSKSGTTHLNETIQANAMESLNQLQVLEGRIHVDP
jgi:hypothetical protein